MKLTEFSKDEWFSVARRLRPNLTEEEYTDMWDTFVQYKIDLQDVQGGMQ